MTEAAASGTGTRWLSDLRIPALDGVRGLAILLVVPHNASLLLDTPLHGPAYAIKELMLLGWLGVQLFFVLSGFLISGALLDSQASPDYYRTFYARRALRILPLYYGVLILTFLILAPLQWLPAAILQHQRNQIWLWTFLSNWAGPLGYDTPGFGHYWSLAVEEQFYLLWPLLIHRLPPRRVLTLCVAVCVLTLGLRIAMRAAGCSADYLYTFTVCRMDALAMGAACAALLRIPEWQQRIARYRRYLPWLGLGAYAACALPTHDYERTGWATQTYGMSVLSFAFACLILAAAETRNAPDGWLARVLGFGPLRAAGKYSYAMYVFHYPLAKSFGPRLFADAIKTPSVTFGVLYAVGVTVASFVLAWLSFHLYEQHFLRMKRHFHARRAPIAGAA